jgi:Leucine-rich repeat (LRR) protein
MSEIIGNILKLESSLLSGAEVDYFLPLSEHKIPLSKLIGSEISLEFTGRIHCIASGELIKKSYGQGYSYKSFITLAQCDLCIVKPELCHYEQGTCREPQWGRDHCLQPHVVYLSETSAPKVGITRLKNIPTRWVDQGALQAIELFRVSSRKDAGLHEIELSNLIGDKTDWRKMLTKEKMEHDLIKLKNEILSKYQELLPKLPTILSFSQDSITQINYPGSIAKKLTSLSFDKNAAIKSKLLGIRGQYLIFDQGVLNIRKFQGYEIAFNS